jgi:hypothetical protein
MYRILSKRWEPYVYILRSTSEKRSEEKYLYSKGQGMPQKQFDTPWPSEQVTGTIITISGYFYGRKDQPHGYTAGKTGSDP